MYKTQHYLGPKGKAAVCKYKDWRFNDETGKSGSQVTIINKDLHAQAESENFLFPIELIITFSGEWVVGAGFFE